MNDNIIKMFIGGEEVVSNKEFTINEEMLSASSTILNNCYPATWEESKDYVSNFYYPKDYSKFILGKGNFTYGTDQYSILSVSGETFMQFTTNIEKEWNSFNVYGNTYQETRSGKNLFNPADFTTKQNVSCNIEGIITSTGIGTGSWQYSNSQINTTLNAGTYKITIFFDTQETSTSSGIRIYNSSGAGLALKYNLSNLSSYTLTITLNSTTNIGIMMKLSNVAVAKLQIELGNEATAYEKYGVQPSPDYPSELISVGYQNLFDIDNLAFATAYYSSTGSFVASYQNGIFDYIEVKSSTNYSLIINQAIYNISISEFDENKVWLGRNNTSNTSINTIKSKSNTKYIRISFNYNNSITMTKQIIKDYQPILIEDTQAHSYIPYGKYGIEVKTTGKNLCYVEDGTATSQTVAITFSDNKLILNGTTSAAISANSNIWKNIKFTVRESGKYKISSKSAFPAGTVFGYYMENSSTMIGTGSVLQPGNYTVGIYIPANATFNNFETALQIEPGETSTDFEPYQGNTQLYVLDNPLRSNIDGTIKDLAYIKNGMLYVDRKIGSIVLNGSENWGIVTRSDGTTKFFSYSTSTIYTNTASLTNELSNYFILNNPYTYTGDSFWLFKSGNNNIFRIGFADQTINTVALFKTWLSTHNTEVQYILAEPYTEEIGQVLLPSAYNGINNIFFYTGLETTEDVYYYWKNYDTIFAGIVKNSGDISLRPTNPKYCSLQILDYKAFLSESDTLDFVISDKTIAEAISMVVDAISGYGFVLGTINISQADDIIGAYSTLNKTAYDVFQYLANISGSRWRARFVDSDTMAIDFYDPELLPRANDIDYTQQYWEDNKIVDLTFNYGTRDYRNKQIILSDEVYGGIDYTEVLLSNGYGTSYITQNNIANITSITVNGVEAEVITQSEKDLGVDADFYYTPGKNVVESTTSYTAGTQIIITYTPLVKGRQIVYNDEEVTRIATQTNTTGVISRYENRNDILSSDELENIAESYIKYKGKPEIILKLTTLNNDLFNIGEICYFNSPIADLAQDYMVKSKATNYTSVAGETNIFYTYELTSSFNSEKAINYFDNQRNKATGNIAEGESITRNIDINNSAMIIWENATITEISVSVDGDNALNSVLNSPFIQ